MYITDWKRDAFSIMPVISFHLSPNHCLNAYHLNWIHSENSTGSFYFFKKSSLNLGQKQVINGGQPSFLPSPKSHPHSGVVKSEVGDLLLQAPHYGGAFSVFIHPITGPFICLEERIWGGPWEAQTQGGPRRQSGDELGNGSLVVESWYTPHMLNSTGPVITVPGYAI